MSELSKPTTAVIVLAAGLLAGWATPNAAYVSRPQVVCAPAAPPMPIDYLRYHALVSPQAALSERRSQAAACAPRKGIRT